MRVHFFPDVRAQLRPDDREQRHRRDDPYPGAGAGEDQHDAAVGPHLLGLLTPASRAEGKGTFTNDVCLERLGELGVLGASLKYILAGGGGY